MANLKISQLKQKSKEELLTLLSDLRKEQLDNKTSSKSKKNNSIKKNIARILTLLNINQREELKKAYKDKKYVPLDLRPKMTKSMRKKAKISNLPTKTRRHIKMERAFPKRLYALRD